MPTEPQTESAIEIRVDDIAQLFDTLDPFPFRERDLDMLAAILGMNGLPIAAILLGVGGTKGTGSP